ncbi:MAG TPA: hypothetical protein VJ875_00080 [Pyrinomonadaceae bacterium]|nr:hypothetical protein [Pyrinomonadaceae bacterium]
MYNDPEWASQEEWDAYAWFGFAISEAQAVERLLLIIAAIKSAEAPAQQSENTWFDLYDQLGRLTLGQLRARLERYGVLADDLLDMLKRATDARNALAHEFFVPRTVKDGWRGPRLATKELQKAASLFSNVSTRLELVLWPLMESLHVHRDDVERETDQLLSSEFAKPKL